MLYSAARKGKVGYINKYGELIIPYQYKYGGGFSEGLAAVALNDKLYGCIDENNKLVIDYMFEEIPGFQNGLSEAHLNGRCGLIDRTGSFVVQPVYELIWCHYNHPEKGLIYMFSDDNGCGWAALNGGVLIAPEFDDSYGIDECNWIYMVKDGLVYCYDVNGNIVFHIDWGTTDVFYEDISLLTINNKKGYISRDGSIIIKPKYTDALGCSEGLLAVKMKGKWGFIDVTGKTVIENLYKNVCTFSCGLAAVQTQEQSQWGLINKNGKFYIEPVWDEIYILNDGRNNVELFKVVKGSEYGYLDISGKLIWWSSE